VGSVDYCTKEVHVLVDRVEPQLGTLDAAIDSFMVTVHKTPPHVHEPSSLKIANYFSYRRVTLLSHEC
jgi:hypothetical protein